MISNLKKSFRKGVLAQSAYSLLISTNLKGLCGITLLLSVGFSLMKPLYGPRIKPLLRERAGSSEHHQHKCKTELLHTEPPGVKGMKTFYNSCSW